MGVLSVGLLDDIKRARSTVTVTPALAALFSYAHQWSLQEQKNESSTLSFSSMLASMTGGADPLCGWLRSHLALRGVRAESMTRGHQFSPQALPDTLQTTISFRRALGKARELCLNEASDGLAVRHFMAAYAVVPGYHLKNFLKLRIDRRAWCIELAEHLAAKFPDEREMWLKYARYANPVPSLGFNTDAPEGRDLLNIDREVEAFARLIAARNTSTPLSIGVFGAWGSGKSFFMRRLRKRVESFAKLGRDERSESKYHGQIAQIDFNAWHYSEGNLAACFVDHILRNLRVAPDETDEVLRKRSEIIIRQLDTAKQDLAARQSALAQAESQTATARSALADLDARIGGEIESKKHEIASAASSLQNAQEALTREMSSLQSDIDRHLRSVPAAAVTSLLLKRLDNPEFSRASQNVNDLIREAKAAYSRRKLILYALIVVAIGAVAVLLQQTNFYVQLVAAATAVSSLAVPAAAWLKKLNAFAESGRELEEEQERLRKAIVQEVTAAHDEAISGLRSVANDRMETVTALSEQLKQLEQQPASAQLALETLEKQREAALAEHSLAVAEVERRKAELAKLTTGSLLEEFLDERASSDGYLKDLTIFSRIRNDFEKLSTLMTRSNDEFIHGTSAEAPVVSRIVLYIDDLDRCPGERVVEVLKLVHLLLAFPLFVCVAAVDPRWVTRCLEEAPGLDIGNASDLTDEVGAPATATDYLEKIFQIPLWLRPVPQGQRAAVVRTMLDPEEMEDEFRFEVPVIAASNRLVTGVTTQEGPEAGENASVERTVDPDIISAKELEYLDRLSTLLDGNPRSLKRFVNTYRLVKTAFPDVELTVFLEPVSENGASYSPYRICMAQLAALCTQRTRARSLVRHADQADANTGLREWLNDYQKIDAGLAQCFREALNDDLDAADVNTFKLWLERTRRYSFYL